MLIQSIRYGSCREKLEHSYVSNVPKVRGFGGTFQYARDGVLYCDKMYMPNTIVSTVTTDDALVMANSFLVLMTRVLHARLPTCCRVVDAATTGDTLLMANNILAEQWIHEVAVGLCASSRRILKAVFFVLAVIFVPAADYLCQGYICRTCVCLTMRRSAVRCSRT
eukprot:COSAG02_NODE_1936_length_10314_cov_6.250024_10_plen_166_part_00